MPAKVKTKYGSLRARLLEKGTNLRRWAEDNSFPVTTVYGAARGLRNGVQAVKIRRKLEEFAYD